MILIKKGLDKWGDKIVIEAKIKSLDPTQIHMVQVLADYVTTI